MRFLWLAVLAAGCATPPAPKPEAVAAPPIAPVVPVKPALTPPTLRLPEGARPISYAVELRVVPGEDTFEGVISFEVEVDRPLETLWLNATLLKILSAQVGGAPAQTEAFGQDFLAVTPARPLAVGRTAVRLEYRGPLSKTELLGVFQLEDRENRYAATQFEALGARRAFPCFDEPAFKVPWTLSLTVQAGDLAFGNSPVASEVPQPNGMKKVTFKPTPPLPSYLVAFAVGPFEVVSAGTAGANRVPLRIITPKGSADQAAFAAAESGKIVDALEAYFGTPYPYEKLDQLAFPQRFSAMEHPGLVTYGYQMLLSRPAEDTSRRQRMGQLTAAHELAHMWFGDLVTMKWWDDLWLNESFAEWLQWKISGGLHPEWHLDVEQQQELGQALTVDALATARQIHQPISSNDDIVGAFDDITYAKGSSVLSQFEAWLRPEVFQQGVRGYLAAHRFGNATAADFFAALSAAAGRDVSVPLDGYVSHAGAPKLSFTLACEPGKPVVARWKQTRYLPIASKGDASTRWQVPVCLRWGGTSAGRACALLTGDEGTLPLEGAKGCPAWVLSNDGFAGYYRSQVQREGKSPVPMLEATLAAKEVTRRERVGLLESLTAQVIAGDIEAGAALAVVPAAMKATEPEVWEGALEMAAALNEHLVPEAVRPKYQAWLKRSFGAQAKKLGFKVGAKDDGPTRLIRPELLGVTGELGEEAWIRAEGQRLGAAWLTDKAAVHPDLLPTALMLAANGPDPKVHERMVAAARAEKDPQHRGKLLRALSNVTDPARLPSHFALVNDPAADIRETFSLVYGAARDPRTREAAWTFLEQNFDQLAPRMPSDFVFAMTQVGAGFCDAAHRARVEQFFRPRQGSWVGMPRELDQVLEGIDLCIAQQARHAKSVEGFLGAASH